MNAEDGADVKIDRAYIGSCTGGKITDFIYAARILKGKKVKVDTYIVPSTVDVERSLSNIMIEDKTLREIFEESGCMKIAQPSCAACLGGPIDTYGRCNGSEVCISTTNRNFPGRMGSKDSKTILSSPMTAAASALKGFISAADV
jgi:3-isopropylmalate/(R)-2-methylmalate dehydratase large subunit